MLEGVVISHHEQNGLGLPERRSGAGGVAAEEGAMSEAIRLAHATIKVPAVIQRRLRIAKTYQRCGLKSRCDLIYAKVEAMTCLGRREAALLRGHLDRLASWDPRAAVRIVATPSALGVYAVLPHEVIAFLALPASGDEGDVTRSAADVRVALGSDRLAEPIEVDLFSGDQVLGSSALADLPPAEGWQMPIHAVSEDLLPKLESAVAELRARSAGVDARTQQLIHDEIWARVTWAGLPMRVLHNARQLGFLVSDPTRVSAATFGPWKRFATVRGQMFLKDRATETLLRVVRQS